MPTFQSPQEVYGTLGAFLQQITTEDDMRPKFVNADTSFIVTYTDPACSMKVDCTQDPPWSPSILPRAPPPRSTWP